MTFLHDGRRSSSMARPYELITPLGPDVLLFRALSGREELGRLSAFDLWALSTRGDINPGDLLGKSVTVKVALRDGGYRYFNLYVVRFAHGASMVGRYHEHRLTLRPWLWFLTRTADCRIFQEKTVAAILKEVFADHSAVPLVDDGLTGTYSRRGYRVQYRETDFDFASRILEEEGIYHDVEHADGKHTLKLVDSYSRDKALEHRATIPYYPPAGANATAEHEHFLGLEATTVEVRSRPRAGMGVHGSEPGAAHPRQGR